MIVAVFVKLRSKEKMTKNNHENDIIKKKYLIDMKLDELSDKTIDAARQAIDRLEIFTGFKNFKELTSDTLEKFRNKLLVTKNAKGGDLTLSTIVHILKPLQKFFKWLKREGGYKNKLKSIDLRYLNLGKEDRRKLNSIRKLKEYYTIDDVKRALNFNPMNDVEMRDRVVIAMLACTAMRHESLITAKIGHIDIKKEAIFQDPRTMRTKKSKWINTRFIPIDDTIVDIIINWVRHLKEELGFTDNDPLFPKELLQHNEYKQFVGGIALSRNHIESHGVIPKIVKRIFEKIGLKYNNPHSFRDMLTHHIVTNYGIQEAAALSLNLGHENLAITLGNYYQPTPEQQFDILSKVGKPKDAGGDISKELLAQLKLNNELLTSRSATNT